MTRLFDADPLWDDDDARDAEDAYWGELEAEEASRLRAANHEPEPGEEPIRPMGCLPDEEPDDLPF